MKYENEMAESQNDLNNEYEMMDEEIHYDLCSIYDFRDDPPPGLFDDADGRGYGPFCETILRKIGNTWYLVQTSCGGTEPLTDKVKRLIFSDPTPGKAVWQG